MRFFKNSCKAGDGKFSLEVRGKPGMGGGGCWLYNYGMGNC